MWLLGLGTDLNVLDEESDLHGASHLPPDGGYSSLVSSLLSSALSQSRSLAWYPSRVFMVTLFWMTSAVIGIRGSTSMCRMKNFWGEGHFSLAIEDKQKMKEVVRYIRNIYILVEN